MLVQHFHLFWKSLNNSSQFVFILDKLEKPEYFLLSLSAFSKLKPNSKLLKNLIFAFNVCRYTKSNAIVLANNKSTIGIGSGQPSRLDSCEIAINK